MSLSDAPTYFTRHLLRAGLQCPVKLFYNAKGYPEDERIIPFLEHAGFNKYYLKKLLSSRYEQAELMRESSRRKSAEKTAQLLQEDAVVLLEATFITDQFYAKVPLLEKDGDHITISDIKTKAFHPYKHRLVDHDGNILGKWKPYLIELAYKRLVVEKMFPDFEYATQLILPDKTKTAGSDWLLRRLNEKKPDVRGEELFHSIDVTDLVDSIRYGHLPGESHLGKSFDTVVHELSDIYFNKTKIKPPVGRRCKKCEFHLSKAQQNETERDGFVSCWSESDKIPDFKTSKPTVIDLIGPGVNVWLDRGIFLQEQVPLKEVPTLKSLESKKKAITQKQRQSLQIRQSKGRVIPNEIIKQPVFDEIGRWEFPLHFLDFEAGNYAVPIRSGRGSYDLVLFQFSCHTLAADGKRTHHQWIARKLDDYPNYALVRQMMQIPRIREGTIVQYSNFEHYALKHIRKELKREQDQVEDATMLIAWLNDIVERRDSNHAKPPYLADLSRLVKHYYYNAQMGSSLSIKDVLQSVMTVSVVLKNKYSLAYESENFENIRWWQWDEEEQEAKSPYKILRDAQGAATVGRGTEAMVKYGHYLAGTLRPSESDTVFKSLLKYCELDTLAMVMIWEHWNSLKESG